MSSPKWSGKKKFNPNRTFVVPESSPMRKFNPNRTFMPTGGFSPTSAGSTVASGASSLASTPSEQVELLSLYQPPLHPLHYQLYAPSPFRVHLATPTEPWEHTAEDFATPDELRCELQERNAQTLQVLPGPSALPEHVHTYYSLVPLDLTVKARGVSGAVGEKDHNLFGAATFRYKAISHVNARTYCLLRVDNLESFGEHENPLQIVNKWKRVQSSAVAGVVEAFTTLAFGTAKPSLIVVYEYFPLVSPLVTLPKFPPWAVWPLAVQLVGALNALHRRGLACRGLLNEHFVLAQGDVRVENGDSQRPGASAHKHRSQRVRLGSLGVVDILKGVLTAEESATAERQDFADLGAMLGRLVSTEQSLPADLSDLLDALQRADTARIDELVAPHTATQLEIMTRRADDLEDVLSQELENGRLFRLLAKLEYVLEGSDPSDVLAKTYALHLFKKFVFGQHTEQGGASLNLAHALAALNKLDVGIDENVLLVSADAKTRIILSYKELKDMFNKEFEAKIAK